MSHDNMKIMNLEDQINVVSKSKTQRIFDEITRWISYLAENTSLHGIVWYDRVENKFFKSIICFISALIIIGLPVILIGQILEFQEDKTVLTSVDLVKSLNVTYPNITICHPRFFDVEKLQGMLSKITVGQKIF